MTRRIKEDVRSAWESLPCILVMVALVIIFGAAVGLFIGTLMQGALP